LGHKIPPKYRKLHIKMPQNFMYMLTKFVEHGKMDRKAMMAKPIKTLKLNYSIIQFLMIKKINA